MSAADDLCRFVETLRMRRLLNRGREWSLRGRRGGST